MIELYTVPILLGIVMGTTARWSMLQVDYRQYPSFPHGYTINLAMGFIASALGAIALPAVLELDFVAVTFLALAAQHFRDIRELVRSSLDAMEETELIQRGSAYIEGIARAFEARNYLSMAVALIVSAVALLSTDVMSYQLLVGLGTGIILMVLIRGVKSGQTVGDIARVRLAELRFEGPNLFIEDIYLMNLALEGERELYRMQGLGVMIEPVDDNASSTLANMGQRQAIAHEATLLLGVRMDIGDNALVPIVRRDPETGKVGMNIIPIKRDPENLIRAIEQVPVLESSQRKPLESGPGLQASSRKEEED